MTRPAHTQHANANDRPGRRTRRLFRGGLAIAVAALAVAGAALAYYLSSGSGTGHASVGTIDAPTSVAATAANSSTSSGPSPVTITWNAPSADATPTGYAVVRDNGSTQVTVSCNSSPCTDTNVPDGTYTYHVQSLLNTSWTSAAADSNSLVVVNDSTAPTTTITFPANNGSYNAAGFANQCSSGSETGICGTASDPAPSSGLANVQVSIQKVGGNYWNGSSFGSASEQKMIASGTGSWTLAFAAANFATAGGGDGSYTVRVYATDNAGNTQAAATSQTFTYDKTTPTSAITFPSSGPYNAAGWNAGASSEIAGTATDPTPGSGLANVQVSIQKVGGNYWNGSSFGSASEQKMIASGTGSWTLAFAAANFATAGGGDGSYTVRVYATDNAGNTQAAATSQTFTYDNTPPTVTMNAQNVTGVSITPTFSGTAGNQGSDATHSADDSMVTVFVCAGTQVSCSDGSGTLAQTYTTTRTGTTWTVTPDLAHALYTNTTYTAQAAQSDGAGNTGSSFGVTTFTTSNSFTQSTPGTYTLSVAPHITSFTFTLNGAGGGGGDATKGGASGAAGGSVSGTIHVPDSVSTTTLTFVIGGGGATGSGVTGGSGGAGGAGCAAGGMGGSDHIQGLGGGGGGAATCIYKTSSLPIAVAGGGGGGGSKAGGAGSGGTNGTAGTSGTSGSGGGGGSSSGPTGGAGGTSGGVAGGINGNPGGAGGGATTGNDNSGGGGGGGYASGGGGGHSTNSGGGGGGSGFSGGDSTFTVIGATTGTGSGGGAAGNNGTGGSVTFAGAGLTDPVADPSAGEPGPPPATTTDTTTTDTTTTATDTTTTDTTTTDSTTTDPTSTATCTADATTTDTTTTSTATDTTTTDTTPTDTTTTAPAGTTCAGGGMSGPMSMGLSTGREVLFFAVLGGSVLGLVALLTMPIPRRRRARRRRVSQ